MTQVRDINSVRSDLKHIFRMFAVVESSLEEEQDQQKIARLKIERAKYLREIQDLEIEYAASWRASSYDNC